MAKKPFMDFSLGDPALPFTEAAKEAFERSARDVHKYHLTNPSGTGSEFINEALAPVRAHFTARGIHSPGWAGLSNGHALITGGGTTEGFNLICRLLAKDVESENRHRDRISKGELPEIEPVILMPAPTYGFFQQQTMSYGIGALTFERDMANGGALTEKIMHDAFALAHSIHKRVIGFYDSNPHNPLGLVRGRAETEKLAEILGHYSDIYQKQDESVFRSAWRGCASRIRIIDDMVYDGLQYEGAERPFSFAELPQCFDDTFLITGLSKVGLAGLRAGLVIGHSQDISQLREMQMEASYYPSLPAMHAIAAYFNDAAENVQRKEQHLAQLNQTHEFAGKFMKALIAGTGAVENLKSHEHQKMVETLATIRKIEPAQAEKTLRKGIPGVKVGTNPQAGFFHMLDFSDMRYHSFNADYCGARNYAGANRLRDEEALHTLFKEAGLQVASGTFTGLDAEKMMVRVTFAKPLEQIAEFAARLQWMAREMKPPSDEFLANVRAHDPYGYKPFPVEP